MSNVDLSAIEEKIKMASLDQHRGYAQNHSAEIKQERATEYLSEDQAAGYQIVREPFWNKGEFVVGRRCRRLCVARGARRRDPTRARLFCNRDHC